MRVDGVAGPDPDRRAVRRTGGRLRLGRAGIASPAPACPPAPPFVPPPALGQAGWWRDRVFAEIFVRSFADSDGDGIGDLRGLTAKLDYLNDGDAATTADLGVTGLWLMPTFPSPSYHGYDVTDYRGVNPDYGTLADLRPLVAAAHERGIAVILDLPLNHTSRPAPVVRRLADGQADRTPTGTSGPTRRRARLARRRRALLLRRTSAPTCPT